MWFSGSKSYHVHFFIDVKQATNISLLKSVVMRYYTKDLDIKPDLGLAGKHLVRAEYGLNEKTGNPKRKIRESPSYPQEASIVTEAWQQYVREMNWLLKRTMSVNVKDLADSDLIKRLLDTTYFNDNVKDGRSRVLFVLANVLKAKYEKKDLVSLLQNWYKYTNGKKLTDGQIAHQVYRAYNSDMSPGKTYIHQLLLELGVEDGG